MQVDICTEICLFIGKLIHDFYVIKSVCCQVCNHRNMHFDICAAAGHVQDNDMDKIVLLCS